MAKRNSEAATFRKKLFNRIVGLEIQDVDQLLANPANFRVHPAAQQAALAGSVDEIGFIDPVIVNKNTGHVVDGHLRVTLAMRSGEKTIPVVVVDLSEEEEKKALLLLDPIAAMAATDKLQLDATLQAVSSDDERIQKMLSDLAEKEGLYSDLPTPGDAETEESADAWGVIVYCEDEEQQLELLERMGEEGYQCKALL